MKREVDPCQTGWDDYDPAVGVGLLSLYGPGGMNNTYRQVYRPHNYPLKLAPGSERAFTVEAREEQSDQSHLSPKFMFSRLAIKDKVKKFMCGRQHKTTIEAAKVKESKKLREQKPLQIKCFNFSQRESVLGERQQVSSERVCKQFKTIEGKLVPKRLCVKDQLERIVRNRRIKSSPHADESVPSKKRKVCLPTQRYSTMDSHSQIGTSMEQKGEKAKPQNFLDCSIINLSERTPLEASVGGDKRRERGRVATEMRTKRELYRSNLLREFQGRSNISRYRQGRTLSPQVSIMRLKQIIRGYLNSQRGVLSGSRLPLGERP